MPRTPNTPRRAASRKLADLALAALEEWARENDDPPASAAPGPVATGVGEPRRDSLRPVANDTRSRADEPAALRRPGGSRYSSMRPPSEEEAAEAAPRAPLEDPEPPAPASRRYSMKGDAEEATWSDPTPRYSPEEYVAALNALPAAEKHAARQVPTPATSATPQVPAERRPTPPPIESAAPRVAERRPTPAPVNRAAEQTFERSPTPQPFEGPAPRASERWPTPPGLQGPAPRASERWPTPPGLEGAASRAPEHRPTPAPVDARAAERRLTPPPSESLPLRSSVQERRPTPAFGSSAPSPSPSRPGSGTAPRPPSIPPARGSSPPPPLDAKVAPPPEARPSDEAVAEREQFGEFTRALVQTMNRQSYYDESHPSHYAVSDELYHQLLGILAAQPQVAFLLQRGQTQEMFVDGTSLGRVKLGDVMVGGTFEIFVPRLIEYFDRYQLVMLAFRRGLTREEFARFVTVLTRPMQHADQRFDLQRALLDADVLFVTVLGSEDMGEDADLPWQVRVCLARLRRDLRTMPLYRDLDAEGHRRLKVQIFADVVRPLYLAEQLKVLVLRAPRIERDLGGVPGLEDLRVIPYLVQALTQRALVGLARALVEEIAGAEAEDRPRLADAQATVLLCAQRLLEEGVHDAEPVLRLLHKHAIVSLEELPEELREWMIAESLATDDAAVLALPLETAGERAIAVKLARLAYSSGRMAVVVEVVRSLRALGLGRPDLGEASEQALSSVLRNDELREAVERLDRLSGRDLEAFAQIFLALGPRVAEPLVNHLVGQGERVRFSPAYHLLDKIPELAVDEVADALATRGVAPAVLRVLLTHVAQHPDERNAATAVQFAAHPVSAVRMAALAAVMAGRRPEAPKLLRAALLDADAEIASMALTALAERFDGAVESQARAVSLLSRVGPESKTRLTLAAIQIVAAHSADEPARVAALAALRRVVVEEEQRSGFLGIGSYEHPEVLDAAKAAIAKLLAEHGGAVEVGEAGAKKGLMSFLTNRRK